MKVHQSTDVTLKVLNPLTIYFLTDRSTPEKYVDKLRSLNKDPYIDRRIFTIGLESRDYFATIEKDHPGCNVLVRLFGGDGQSSKYVTDTIDVSSAKKDILPKLKDLIEKAYDLDIDLLEKQQKEYERADDRERQDAVTRILRAFRRTKPISRSGIREIKTDEYFRYDSNECFERTVPDLDRVTDTMLKRLISRIESHGKFTPGEYDDLRRTVGIVVQLKVQEGRSEAVNNEESVRILPYEGWKSPCRFVFNGGVEEIRMRGRLDVFIYVLALMAHKKGGVIYRNTLMWTIKEETLNMKDSGEIQKWFIDLYNALLHPVKTFKEWWEEITDNMENFDTDLTQAVSNINGIIRKAVGKNSSSLELKSEKFDTKKGGDSRKVAYYYITLPKERIDLPKKLEQLLPTMPEFLVHSPGATHIEE